MNLYMSVTFKCLKPIGMDVAFANSTSSMKIWHFPNSMASMLYLEEVGWQEKQLWDQRLSKNLQVPLILDFHYDTGFPDQME